MTAASLKEQSRHRRRTRCSVWRRREPPGSNRHRHADERIRRKDTCATPGGCRVPRPRWRTPACRWRQASGAEAVNRRSDRQRRRGRSLPWRCSSAGLAGTRTKAGVPSAGRARLDLGDSSSQVDRRRGGLGPRSCVGTRLGNHDRSAALRLPRRGALRYVRRFGSAASGCRNRTNLAVGQHRRTALPSTTSASGRRRSSRSISPELRVSSGPGARSALTRVAARPREREPGALAGRRGSRRQQAHRRLP